MAVGQVITSSANSLLKEVRRSIARGTATEDGFVVAESVHLLAEALRSKVSFHAVLASERASLRAQRLLRKRPDVPLRVIDDRVFEGLAGTETTQGVISLVRLPEWDWDDAFRESSPVVVLDGIQDPGNAGAIVRSAEAFGAASVIFLHGTVGAANPKTIRASAGSIFRVPFLERVDVERIATEIRQRKRVLLSASAHAEQMLSEQGLTAPSVIVIGSEARGVCPELRTFAQPVRISTEGVESLNAAVAAAVILYEAARQREHVSAGPRFAESP